MVVSRSVFISPANLRDWLLFSPDSLGNAPGAWKNVVADGTDAMPNATQSWLNWSWLWLGLSHESESEGISLWSDTKINPLHLQSGIVYYTVEFGSVIVSFLCLIWYCHNKKPRKWHQIASWKREEAGPQDNRSLMQRRVWI